MRHPASVTVRRHHRCRSRGRLARGIGRSARRARRAWTGRRRSHTPPGDANPTRSRRTSHPTGRYGGGPSRHRPRAPHRPTTPPAPRSTVRSRPGSPDADPRPRRPSPAPRPSPDRPVRRTHERSRSPETSRSPRPIRRCATCWFDPRIAPRTDVRFDKPKPHIFQDILTTSDGSSTVQIARLRLGGHEIDPPDSRRRYARFRPTGAF